MAVITKVSPLAPKAFLDLPVIKGVRFATAAAGVKYQGRTDVMLAVADAAQYCREFSQNPQRGQRQFWIVRIKSGNPAMRVLPFW